MDRLIAIVRRSDRLGLIAAVGFLMRRLGALIIAAWASWLSGEPAIADERMALVIGNSGHANVARLGNPANDATAMTATCTGLE
jgi:hypothetical protein